MARRRRGRSKKYPFPPRLFEYNKLELIQLAIIRFRELGENLEKGNPQTVNAQLMHVRELREIVGAGLDWENWWKKRAHIQEQISQIEEREKKNRGFLKSLLEGPLSQEVKAEVARLSDELRFKGREGRPDEFDSLSYEQIESYDKTLERYERVLEKSLIASKERAQARLDAAERTKAKKELALARKAEKEALMAGMAAAHAGKTRQLAASVRRNIENQRESLAICPYCGKDLGKNPEADHIYPVARGGLSTEDNMVFVCSRCNGKKRDMTLREFAKAMKYDLLVIEERLEILGKRF